MKKLFRSLNKKYNSFFKNSNHLIIIIILVASFISIPLVFSQLRGDDEGMVLDQTSVVVHHLKDFDFMSIIETILKMEHPPMRYLILLPFYAIFGMQNFEAVLRMPHVFFWILVCVQAFFIGKKIAHNKAGFYAGMLLAGSGLFNIQAMAHGYSLTTFCVLLFVYLQLDSKFDLADSLSRKKYFYGNIILFIGFTTFTTVLPILAVYQLAYLFYTIRRNRLKKGILLFLRFSFLHWLLVFAYYAFFFGIQMYQISNGTLESPYGQYAHNLGRRVLTGLNTSSFFENLRGLNGYYFPYISAILLVLCNYFIFKYNRVLFLVLLSYGLLFSFYIKNSTFHHFTSYLIYIIPLGVGYVFKYLSTKKKRSNMVYPVVVDLIFIVLIIIVGLWTNKVHLTRYEDVDYPNDLLENTNSLLAWKNNLDRPLEPLKLDLFMILDQDELWRYSTLSEGGTFMQYMPAGKYEDLPQMILDQEKDCYEAKDEIDPAIKAIIVSDERELCIEGQSDVIIYEGSLIRLVVLPRS